MPHKPLNRFFNFTIGWIVSVFASYWMYLCCNSHWLQAIGPQNLIFLLLVALLSFIALIFYTRNKIKEYHITALISFIPGIVVCYINRASRYPDLNQLITTFQQDHVNDPICIGYHYIYSEDFLQYEYITCRSSTSSMNLFVLELIWFVIIIHKYLFSK